MILIRILLRSATLYGLIAPVVIIDCMTRFSSPVMAMIHGTAPAPILPPDDFSGSSSGTLLWIIAGTLIALTVGLAVIRFVTWLLIAKTGWFGRTIGETIILGVLKAKGTTGKNWRRDWLVRTLYRDMTGRKMKSLSAIRKRCGGHAPITQGKAGKAANDNRKGHWNIEWSEAA